MTLKKFLDAASRGKYMTPGAFLRSLNERDWHDLVGSAKDGETLDSVIKRWAQQHAPDITLVDDDHDDNKFPNGKDHMITCDGCHKELTDAELKYGYCNKCGDPT